MKKSFVSIIILTWNSLEHIDDCVSSMLKQSYPAYKILVIDSCSSDDTVCHLRTNYPQVQIVELSENLGYRRGNAVGMQLAEGDFVIICNDDVIVETDWLTEMVRVMQNDETVGLVTPMILHADRPDLINVAGNILHFSGMYGPRGKDEPKQEHARQMEISAISGCCFMIRRGLMVQLGGFSSDFNALDVGWHASFEDVDLGWRAQMLGYRLEYVPAAVMYHKYKQPGMFPARFAAHEWGRYLAVWRNYSLVTLIAISPLLLALELMTWAYAFKKGSDHLRAKALVIRWLLWHPRMLWRMRRRVQAFRTTSDMQIVKRMSPILSLQSQLGNGRLRRLINGAFAWISYGYYHSLLSLLRLSDAIARRDLSAKDGMASYPDES